MCGYTFKLKLKKINSQTDRARVEAVGLRPPRTPRPTGGGCVLLGGESRASPAGPGACGRVAATARRGRGIPHLEGSRRRRPGDRAGIFQWGRRLLKGALSARGGRHGAGTAGTARPGCGGGVGGWTPAVHPRTAPWIPWLAASAGFS